MNSLKGSLSSPNYPNPYISNQNCSWRLPERGSGYTTELYFKHLDFGSDCKQLTMSTSSAIFDACSITHLNISYYTSVVVTFQSKENYNKSTGFEVQYELQG